MKNSFWFPVLLALLALSLACASCAPAPAIKESRSPAYSDKAGGGLRPEREAAGKKQEKSAENAPTKNNHTDHHANGEHHDHGGHHAAGNHHHGMACAANLPREKADIPDFASPRWVPADSFLWHASEKLDYRFASYRDTTRPELAVAAVMTTSYQDTKRSPLIRVMWEVGDEIRSTFLKTNKPVCVKPVVTHNRERLGLAVFYKRLKTQAAKLPPKTKTP